MLNNKNYIKKLIEDNSRVDGRGLDEFRELTIKTGILKSAEGSAQVRLGNTQVVVGVKMSIMTPFPDTPDEGVLMVGAEFDPIASPEFENGPPSAESIELARVVDRAIRESKAVELGKLVIEAGEKVWAINLDIHIFDHDGNLQDAASAGAIAALLTTKIPAYDKETDKMDHANSVEQLPVVDVPVEVSISKIGNKLVLDPTKEEESAVDAKITMGTTKTGNLCAMQKSGIGFFTEDEIKQATELAIVKGDDIREILRNAL